MSDLTQATSRAQAVTGRSVITSASWVTGSHLVAQTFAYGSLILLARWLPPASFGTVAVGTSIVWFAALFVDQGVWGTLVVQRGLTRADLARAFWRCLVAAVVLAAGMAAAAGWVVEGFVRGGNAAAIAALAISLPLHAVAVVPMALLQKSMRFRRLGGVNAVANIVSAVVAVAMALAGGGVWALVARQLVLFGIVAVLSAALCLPVLRDHETRADTLPRKKRPRGQERWFFLFAVARSLKDNASNFMIGASANASFVGLYSVANTIALAPATQFSQQVGKVLFAAAAKQPETSRGRTEQSVQLMSMLMLPILPVGILTAPTILPAVFGAEWKPMVSAFQVLLVAGVLDAIVNCIGEPLAGMGHMRFRANVMVVRCGATLLALAILVPIDGIRGAALAELLVFVPAAALYVTAGARRAGTSPAALWLRLRPVAAAVSVQLSVTFTVLISLVLSGVAESVAECVASAIGLIACIPVLLRTRVRNRP
jgi:teichuronic acid exporter